MKNTKLLNPKVGDLVVLNNLDDAAVFRIRAIEGFQVTLRDPTVDNAADQYTDKSLLFKLNATQLKNFDKK